MSVLFHSLHLNSQIREWSFHSLLLKLPNRGKEKIFLKYSYFSISFYSFPHSQTEFRFFKQPIFILQLLKHHFFKNPIFRPSQFFFSWIRARSKTFYNFQAYGMTEKLNQTKSIFFDKKERKENKHFQLQEK